MSLISNSDSCRMYVSAVPADDMWKSSYYAPQTNFDSSLELISSFNDERSLRTPAAASMAYSQWWQLDHTAHTHTRDAYHEHDMHMPMHADCHATWDQDSANSWAQLFITTEKCSEPGAGDWLGACPDDDDSEEEEEEEEKSYSSHQQQPATHAAVVVAERSHDYVDHHHHHHHHTTGEQVAVDTKAMYHRIRVAPAKKISKHRRTEPTACEVPAPTCTHIKTPTLAPAPAPTCIKTTPPPPPMVFTVSKAQNHLPPLNKRYKFSVMMQEEEQRDAHEQEDERTEESEDPESEEESEEEEKARKSSAKRKNKDAAWEPRKRRSPSRYTNVYSSTHTTSSSNAPGQKNARVGGSRGANKSRCAGGGRERRVNRPEHNHSSHAKEILRDWFYSHLHTPGGPYPSEAVKDDLAKQTGLTRMQISNFYINERKRRSDWRTAAVETGNVPAKKPASAPATRPAKHR
jgi:hypothetical protein